MIDRIISDGECLRAYVRTRTNSWSACIVWVTGSHHANVFPITGELEVFTFGWEKNRTSMLDFTTALYGYVQVLNA